MISLAILTAMQAAGIGTIDEDMFWEEMPLNESGSNQEGIWLVTRGSDLNNDAANYHQTFDIYCVYNDKVVQEQKMREVLSFMEQFNSCDLDCGDVSSEAFTNVRIRPVAQPQNAGINTNGWSIKFASGEVYYDLP